MKLLILQAIIAMSLLVGCSSEKSSPTDSDSVAVDASASDASTAAADAADAAAAAADAAAAAVEDQGEATEVSQPNQGAERNGWVPGEACSFLLPTLVTRGYKHEFGNEYYCSSPYKDIGMSSAGMPNNLAYYVTGRSDAADTAKLVLNYNQPANAAAATKQLVDASKKLSLNATGTELPQSILSALSVGRSATFSSGKFRHEVKRDEWPTGRGYEIHYIVTNSLER